MEVNATTGNYPSPYSLSPIPSDIRKGLLVIGTIACISLIATATVLVFIAYNFICGKGHNKQAAAHNQCVILVFNLLLADFQQALAFAISFHWYVVNGIHAPSGFCTAQASLLNFADLASGMFVVTIALHTAYSVFTGKRYKFKWFVALIVAQWTAAFIFTIAGPLHFGEDFFTRAGNWCWISQRYSTERLWLHYFWIFVFQFVSVVTYVLLAFYIWRGSRLLRGHGASSPGSRNVLKAARRMIYYPLIYIIGTLPIAIARMMAMSGREPPAHLLLAAGVIFTSFGWIDALLYTITRKVLINTENGHRLSSSTRRTASNESSFPLNHNGNAIIIRDGNGNRDLLDMTPAISPWPKRQQRFTTPSWGSRIQTSGNGCDFRNHQMGSSKSMDPHGAYVASPAVYLDWSPGPMSPTSMPALKYNLDNVSHR